MHNKIKIKVKEFNSEKYKELINNKKYTPEICYFLSQREKLSSCIDFKVNENLEIPNAKLLAEKLDLILKNNSEELILYTDYDNDGFSGGFIFLDFVKRKYNKNIKFQINYRITEGYGINKEVIKNIAEKNYKYIVTVDLGISNIDEINLANELGLKVFITDHHLPKIDDNGNEHLPNAEIIVNANIENNNGYERGVCGAYTIWHVLSFIDKELANEYIDLVALALISDNMPLNAPLVNHMVKKGLEKMNNLDYSSKFVGNMIEKHKELKKINKINEIDLGFYIIPLINAVGRLSKVSELMEWAINENIEMYTWMKEINEKRKELTTEFAEKADKIAKKLIEENNNILLIPFNECPEGIVGLIASRICEKYKKTTIVATLDETGERYKASGRSKGNYNFKNFFSDPEIKYIVSQVNEFDDEDEDERKLKLLKNKKIKSIDDNKLVQGGGHKFACGMSFPKKHLNLLQERLKTIEQPEEYIFEVDAIISLENEIEKIKRTIQKSNESIEDENAKILAYKNFKKRYTTEFVNNIRKNLYPFGNENPEPIFFMKNSPENIKLLGNEGKHLKFLVNNIDSIAFNIEKDIIENYDDYYIIGNFTINEFKNIETLQFMVKEFIHKSNVEFI